MLALTSDSLESKYPSARLVISRGVGSGPSTGWTSARMSRMTAHEA
jgi:hypothetical protein